MGEGAAKHGKGVEQSFKGMSEGVSITAGKMLELATLFTGGLGITAFMGYVMKGAAELGRLSKVLDTNAQEMWAWEQAGAQVGARSGALSGSWQKLVHTFNDWNIGQPAANAKFIRFFTEQGVQFVDSTNKMRSMTDVYMQLNKAVQSMDPARAESYLRGLGLDPDSINLILLPTERLAKMLEDMKKNAPNAAQIKAAQEAQADFNKTWSDTVSIGSKALPMFSGILGMINSFATGLVKITNQLEEWFTTSRFAKWFSENYNKQTGGGAQGFGFIPGAEGMPTPGIPGVQSPGMGGGSEGGGATPRGGSESGGRRGRAGSATGAVGRSDSGSTAPVGTGAFNRSRYEEEIRNNPELGRRLATIVQGEVGHGASRDRKLVQLESIFNRASARNQSLADATRQWPGPGGYYPSSTFSGGRIKSQQEYDNFVNNVLNPVVAGSDRSTELLGFPTTGNASGGVASRGIANGKYTRHGMLGPETYVQERRDNIARLEASRRANGPPMGATAAWGNSARAVPWLTNPGSLGLMPGGQASNTTNNSSSAETHVGSVTVQTQATDAYGIASDMKGAIERVGNVGNMNNGPN